MFNLVKTSFFVSTGSLGLLHVCAWKWLYIIHVYNCQSKYPSHSNLTVALHFWWLFRFVHLMCFFRRILFNHKNKNLCNSYYMYLFFSFLMSKSKIQYFKNKLMSLNIKMESFYFSVGRIIREMKKNTAYERQSKERKLSAMTDCPPAEIHFRWLNLKKK